MGCSAFEALEIAAIIVRNSGSFCILMPLATLKAAKTWFFMVFRERLLMAAESLCMVEQHLLTVVSRSTCDRFACTSPTNRCNPGAFLSDCCGLGFGLWCSRNDFNCSASISSFDSIQQQAYWHRSLDVYCVLAGPSASLSKVCRSDQLFLSLCFSF